MKKIADPRLEGAIRQLLVLAELAVSTFVPTRPDDAAVLDGLQKFAANVRERLAKVKGGGP